MYYICKKFYYRNFFHIILKVDAFLTSYCFFSYIAGNLVTSRGPATAVEFGLTLVEVLLGNEEKDKVAKGILYPL
jgi:hypothetical protein